MKKNTTIKAALFLMAISLLSFGNAEKNRNLPASQAIDIDGTAILNTFEGLGAIPSYEKLLYDYPEPQRKEILDYLFLPGYGASLQVLKVEIGYDGNNTAVSWPSYKRTLGETPDFERGYVWWLMNEAKKRNPDIRLSALHWGYPAWARTDDQKAGYIFGFVQGAKEKYGLRIDYIGGNQNEQYKEGKPFINRALTIKLRQLLNANGYDKVKIVTADEGAKVRKYRVFDEIQKDSLYAEAVDIIGVHYKNRPASFMPDIAYKLGKPLWSSEDGGGSYRNIKSGYDWVNQIIRLLLDVKMNGIIRWSATASVYDNMPWANNGFIKADEPWSGHYETGSNLWAFSHFTQFTEPGWNILNTGKTNVYNHNGTKAGRFIAFKDNTGDDYTIVINTHDHNFPEAGIDLEINLSDDLSKGPAYLWRSDFMKPSEWFRQVRSLPPAKKKIIVHLDKGCVYTLSTTKGQHRGTTVIPPAEEFPFPYTETFESYEKDDMARYFIDANGIFTIAGPGKNRKGNALRQVVTEAPRMWHNRPLKQPLTEMGNIEWTDYKVRADVLMENPGKVLLSGRFDGKKENSGDFLLEGYWLSLDNRGKWELIRKDPPENPDNRKDTGTFVTLSSGVVPGASLNQWITVGLEFNGPVIKVFIRNKKVAEVVDEAYKNGNVALGTLGLGCKDPFSASDKWSNARFDNLHVTPISRRP
ncbi:hypothetical protein [Sinomicrobium weinanense]|uniref:galactosylceramidase n=1 Tax=Sinomicrobium weinanense TaxID=2842200 RepID=A0A926Q3Z7_9FLAO|nr:hypothetical protein [Sinomicrobium weinanense]MBC9798097.1 hypothetical protein [Sinomicrobium weinanense]MBU3125837.1 hypothetical protein [Sinomicrobium weinanense]